MNACILLLGQLDGAEMVTVEDLASAEGLHPVQEAMVAHHGSQCGFCTPGIVMSLFALYQDGDRPVSRDDVNDALAGNLCRCTGYRPIVDAALEACAASPQDRFAPNVPTTEAALAALDDGEDVLSARATASSPRRRAKPRSRSSTTSHPDATLVAGCTDVGLWLTKGLARLDKMIWLGRVQGLDRIDEGPEALSPRRDRQPRCTPSAALAAIDPDLGELMRRFGGVQVRAAGHGRRQHRQRLADRRPRAGPHRARSDARAAPGRAHPQPPA